VGAACPRCGAADFRVEASIELPADARSDEITLQCVTCPACGLRGAGVYQESRRGRLDAEAWEYKVHDLDEQVWMRLRALLLTCPHPSHRTCGCAAHRFFRAQDENGYWVGEDLFLDL
jgi:hypothetical protein